MLVFRKVQALLGGKVQYVSTGSAPLSGEVFDFARCAFGCLVSHQIVIFNYAAFVWRNLLLRSPVDV